MNCRILLIPPRSSDFTSVNLLASSASFAAYASRPTLVARYAPLPATTKLPDITVSPACFAIESASPVSRDSSTSRLLSSTMSPSTTICSPGPSSMMSSSTTSPGTRACVPNCLRTNGFACPTIASLSSVCLARSSWMMPIALLAMISNPNRPLITDPVDSTMTNSTPRMALIRVKTLARTISETLRAARVGTSLVMPSATRWATSASVSPVATSVVIV